jgi:DNA (cytosine-5)-methyltransferase 1
MTRPRLLDLFCGAGGAAMGYHRAGFEVVGVDIVDQPNYPFEFVQADALEYLKKRARRAWWAAAHGSPPCQRWSDLAKRNGNADEWPDLITPTRALFRRIGLPYVIENVESAPLLDPMILCGTQFRGLRVIRHRKFETSFPVLALPHGRHPLVFTHDKRKAHYGRLDQNVSFVQVTGGGNATVTNKAAAMGIDWMTGKELNEAIPPAYTEHIGAQLLAHLTPTTTAGPRPGVCEALRSEGTAPKGCVGQCRAAR